MTKVSSGADWVSRALPFAIYIGFLLVEEAASRLLPGTDLRGLYGVKVACVALALALLWRGYGELRAAAALGWQGAALSVAAGAAVFVAWISLDQPWATIGGANGFNPLRPDGRMDWAMAAVRLAGAALVVPLMEELFWRSFVLRWIDRHDFLALAPLQISLRALLLSSLLFGLEHHQLAAGVLAGLVYGYLYRRAGSLWAPILAHGVTNAILGAWVLQTRNWQFW